MNVAFHVIFVASALSVAGCDPLDMISGDTKIALESGPVQIGAESREFEPKSALPVASRHSGICIVIGTAPDMSQRSTNKVFAEAIGSTDLNSSPLKAFVVDENGTKYELSRNVRGSRRISLFDEKAEVFLCQYLCDCEEPPTSVARVSITSKKDFLGKMVEWHTEPQRK